MRMLLLPYHLTSPKSHLQNLTLPRPCILNKNHIFFYYDAFNAQLMIMKGTWTMYKKWLRCIRWLWSGIISQSKWVSFDFNGDLSIIFSSEIIFCCLLSSLGFYHSFLLLNQWLPCSIFIIQCKFVIRRIAGPIVYIIRCEWYLRNQYFTRSTEPEDLR